MVGGHCQKFDQLSVVTYIYTEILLLFIRITSLTYLSAFVDIMIRGFRWIQDTEEISVKLVYALGRENMLANFK